MKTKRLTQQDVTEAAEILRRGGLLGIPTETVYGLGADGTNPTAVAAIFAAKGRPQDNPLILHVPGSDWLTRFCTEIPDIAWTLTDRFWPGPLTLILKRKVGMVSNAVTAGLDTVGVRCPANAVTRAVITAAGVPVAAPSGNTSGRPSPTSAADMLEDMDGKVDAILDDGPCSVGVESTILDLTVPPPRLLRPGGVTLEALQDIVGDVAVDDAVFRHMAPGERPKAPGMKYRHYAPRASVTVVQGPPDRTADYIAARLEKGSGVICFDEYRNCFPGCPVESIGPVADLDEQARRIFDALRAFDHLEDVACIWAQSPVDTGMGLAVSNRLNKAAGFHRIALSVSRNGESNPSDNKRE